MTAVLALRGECYVGLGEMANARAAFLEAYAVAEELGSRRMMMQILRQLAKIESDPVQAASLRQRADDMRAYFIEHAPPELQGIMLR